MTGSITVRTNHAHGEFSVGPLSRANSASFAATTNSPAQGFISTQLTGYVDSVGFSWSGPNGGASFGASPYFLLGADITSGTFCISTSSTIVNHPYYAGAGLLDSFGAGESLCERYGTMTITPQIKYDQFGFPVLQKLSGTVIQKCISQSTLATSEQDTLTLTFALTNTSKASGTLTDRPPDVTNAPDVAKPGCFASSSSGSGGGTGGGTGGSGGGTGGGTGGDNPIGVFPGFGGFGAGAFPGQGGGGTTSGSGTSFLAVDIGFDMDEGTPSLENTDELDLPLLVSSTGLKDKVKLTATSDPEGLDLSFDNDTLETENDFTSPILIVKPHPDTQPRDYLITVTATSGDTTSATSFLVSLTCDPPFISSLSTSQPQSQTISVGGKAKLAVAAIGTGPFAYQWYRGTTGNTQFPVSGATTRELTTPALDSSETYWVRVTNPCGTADSNPATVTVH